MRTIVFFDLPTKTKADRHAYAVFRRLLIKNGFVMVQESVYTRLLLNSSAEAGVIDLLRKNRPEKGTVQVLTITEKQFNKIEYITGESHSEVLSSDERLVIL